VGLWQARRRCHVERPFRTMVYMWTTDRTRRTRIPTDGHAFIGVTSSLDAESTEAGIIYKHREGAAGIHQWREMCSADMYQVLRRLGACGTSSSETNCTIMTILHNGKNMASTWHLHLSPVRHTHWTNAGTLIISTYNVMRSGELCETLTVHPGLWCGHGTLRVLAGVTVGQKMYF